jgi:hypothetical protein
MSQTKHASKRKRLRKAVPVVGIAGASLAMAGAASAATAPTPYLPAQGIAPGHQITLGEEEFSDVSLATFFVFDKEAAGAPELGSNVQLARGGGGCGGHGGGCGGRGGGARGGCGGHGGCGGRGCGGRGCGGRGCGLGGCGCYGGCGCGCCLSWGGCGVC